MSDTNHIDRRNFLKTSALLGGGFLISFYLPGCKNSTKKSVADALEYSPNAFIRISTDDIITIIANHSEMGQGAYTALTMLVVEELDADWKTIRIEPAPADLSRYHHGLLANAQITGGSLSTIGEWDRLRKVGASGRYMLIQAAATTWQVDISTCKTDNGFVIHPASNRKLSYGQLAEKAAKLKAPDNPPLKDSKEYKLIGKSIKRLDTPDKINGKAIFGIDVYVPGMLTAVIARPPVYGGTLKSFNAEKAKAMPGVKHVVEINRGIAVVADGFWNAKLGCEALEIIWDDGPWGNVSNLSQGKEYEALSFDPGVIRRKEGNIQGAKSKAVKQLEVTYDLPYLANATMEPMNCVADVKESSCEIWVGTQMQSIDHAEAVRITGLKPEQVRLHTTYLGGGFGRRGPSDAHFVSEAVQVSKVIKNPVKVIWTREDDITGGYYRPRTFHRIWTGLDDSGNPVYWKHNIVAQTYILNTAYAKVFFGDENAKIDYGIADSAESLAYAIPNLEVSYKIAPSKISASAWRSVSSSYNAFVTETMIDELATTAGKDPYEYRLALLEKKPRIKRLLEFVAEKAGWKQPLPAGMGRGIAIHEAFGSVTAQIAEVSISAGKLRVHKVTCAIDCGQPVNPDAVKAQMEGGVIFGLTAALYGEMTFKNGRIQQRNFHDYKMLRINETPQIDVHILVSSEKIGGAGETGVPPIAPAVANALYALTGKRVRNLPIKPDDLKIG